MADDHRKELVIAGTGGAPVALRAGCSGDADTVGAGLDEGSRVVRLAIGGGRCRSWTRVRAADGRAGWVHNSCLQPADEAPPDEAPEAPAAETDAADAPADDPGDARLRELRRLRDDGLITSEEFEDRSAPVEAAAPPGAWALTAGEESGDRAASPPPAEVPAEEVPPAPAPAPAAGGVVAARLRTYAGRLSSAGAQPLGAAVGAYAGRVERVGRGELPPSASANPSALTPELIGGALGRSRFADILELVRNALIFTPVLWTWFEFGRASGNYRDYVRRLPDTAAADSFLVYWQAEGLERTVFVAVALLVAIIAATVLLGAVRGATGSRRTGAAREFAALLAEAEAVGAGRRADDPQEALAAFAAAGRELTAELRDAGGSLGASVQPLADSMGIAREVMTGMSAAVERQQEQIGAIADSLGEVSRVADSLAAIEASFAEASGEARKSAEALDAVRRTLDPQTEELSRAVGGIDSLSGAIGDAAARIGRTAERLGESVAAHAEGAGQFRDAAATMREVAGEIGEVPLIAERLAALETAFAGARDAARESAAALEGIRAGLDPRTEELSRAVNRVADLASRMEHAASQIARATEDYGKSLSGFADGAAQLQHAAATMNEVAVRLRDDR